MSVQGQQFSGFIKGNRGYTLLLVAMFCAGMAVFAQLYSPQTALPAISRDLSISADAAALSISAATAGLALAFIVWVFVADVWGRARTMILGLSVATLLALCLPWVSAYPLLLALRVLEGIFLTGVTGVAISFIVSVTHFSAQVAATSLFISGTSLGGLVGRLISGILVEVVGWRWALMIVSIVGACAASFFTVLLSRGSLAQVAACSSAQTKPALSEEG